MNVSFQETNKNGEMQIICKTAKILMKGNKFTSHWSWELVTSGKSARSQHSGFDINPQSTQYKCIRLTRKDMA